MEMNSVTCGPSACNGLYVYVRKSKGEEGESRSVWSENFLNLNKHSSKRTGETGNTSSRVNAIFKHRKPKTKGKLKNLEAIKNYDLMRVSTK